MIKRIMAIIAIFACTCVAWMILGTSIFLRTGNSGSQLSGRVASTWGTAQEQHPPAVSYTIPEVRTEEVEENGKKITKTRTKDVVRSVPTSTLTIGRRVCCGSALTALDLRVTTNFRIRQTRNGISPSSCHYLLGRRYMTA